MNKKDIAITYHPKTHSKQKIRELISEYQTGERISTLLKNYSLSSSKFYYILKKNSINTRTNRITEEPQEKIINLYLSGEKISIITDKFNIDKTTIYNILDRNNITRNKDSTPSKDGEMDSQHLTRQFF
jgi:Mor family transcriptional regulator